jgi:hypothetical protein
MKLLIKIQNKAIYIIIIIIVYLSAYQRRVAYNRRVLKAYITKARLKLELKLD